jgi:ATP-binding cassette subfamily F protein uup
MLAFEKDSRVTRYAGSYQAYATARAREEEERRAAKPVAAKPKVEKAKPAGLSKNEQRELDGLLDKIDEAEKKAAAIEAELGDPSLYTATGDGAARAATIKTRLEEARALATKLTARWEELETKRGG